MLRLFYWKSVKPDFDNEVVNGVTGEIIVERQPCFRIGWYIGKSIINIGRLTIAKDFDFSMDGFGVDKMNLKFFNVM